MVLIHVTAVVGLCLFPFPGWRVLLAAAVLHFLGGLGTTVCFPPRHHAQVGEAAPGGAKRA